MTPNAHANVTTALAQTPLTEPALPLTGVFRLPPQLLGDAARWLGYLSVFIAVLIVIVEAFQLYAQPKLAPVLKDPVNQLLSVAAVLMGVTMFVLERRQLVTASTLLGIGMVFEIVVAFSIAMVETSWPLNPDQPVLGLSSLGPWIVAVGVIIPNRPIWTFATALAAATMWPVAYAINHARLEFTLPPWGTLLAWPVINYLLAVLAYLIGKRIYGTAIAAQSAIDLGSYRLVAPIGKGGMGEVWRASHRMLARAAAIKLIKAETLGSSANPDDLLQRFEREAQATASLESPHTVELYDFGVADDGTFYYVMELLRGLDLDACVRNRVQSIARLLREAPLEQMLEARVEIPRQPGRIGLGLEHVGEDVRHGLAAEERQPREHLVEHDAEGPDVGALVGGLPARLLRAHVPGCAEHQSALRHRDAQCR